MFTNPVYNLPAQFNENLLPQNLAALSLNSAPPSQHQDHHHLHQQRQIHDYGSMQFQQPPPELGGYVPPSLNDAPSTGIQWPAPDDVNVSYQRGSTVVRQYNNSMIDDYYKKFLRPITDYVAIPTNGQPTYVYQNLGGSPSATTNPIGGTDLANTHQPAAVVADNSPAKADGAEEKKHKKKHKKRSSKHGHGDSSKNSDGEKATDERNPVVADKTDQQQTPAPPSATSSQASGHQQQPARDSSGNHTGAAGPQVPMRLESNPVVYFDIEIDDEPRGRLIMELFRHVLPRTTQNFLALCLNEHGFGYRLSYFHRIIPGFMAQAGDFEKSNGTGGYSIYGDKFDDEGFPYPHDRAGLLSMANSGPHTNGSQFFITFAPCPHLDNKHVAFGQVLQGFHLLKDLEMSGSDSGEVLREVKIAAGDQLQ